MRRSGSGIRIIIFDLLSFMEKSLWVKTLTGSFLTFFGDFSGIENEKSPV